MLNHDGTVDDDDDDDDDDKGNTSDGDGLLAYMAGRSSSAGDIRKVLATKTKIPKKVRALQVQVVRLMSVNRLQVLYKFMIALTICIKESQSNLMVISTLHIRLISTIGSDNMLLLAWNTRL
jgi:hypothetical protein